MSTPDEFVAQGEALLKQGRLDEAAQAYADALVADHQHVDASLGLARISLTLSLVEQAITLLDHVLASAPKNLEALVLRGLAEEASGRLPAALDYFGRASKLAQVEAQAPAPRLERARPRRAPPEEPALVTAASAYSARYHHGRALAVARRYEEALPELMAAAQLQHSATDPHYTLGIAYKESGRIGEAIGAFARALEIDPTFLDGYMTLADVLCEAGKLDTAEQVLQQAQSLFPDSGPVHDKLAAVYLKKNDYPRVIEALQGQVRIEPENESASVNLATCAILIGDYATAAEAIDSLLRRDPSSWRGHHLRSMLYDAADKVELAMEELREAARLAPWEWKPFNDLGTLLNARARTDHKTADEAVEVLEKAVTLAPADELAPRYNLGLAYWNAGRRIDARSTLDEMIRTGPPDDRLVQQAREVASAMDAELGKQPGQDVDLPP